MKQICPYCRAGFGVTSSTIYCGSCGSAHHSACWELNGCCSIYGCRNASIRSKIRWSLLPLAILILSFIPSIQKITLFLLLPLFVYTFGAIGSYLKEFRRA